MKKTLTINISGLVFHIDEDAYQELNHYLENLRRHFSPMGDSQEIMEDIETRIAEILKERLGETRMVITIDDIAEVIRLMGRPSEIGGEEEKGAREGEEADGKGIKRFFRDPENKVIAGVCSGIGTYFHIDPVIVRLIFILFVLAGGAGILVYLVLWFAVPEARTTSDKLMMRGEKVTVASIEKALGEELKSLKEQLGKMANGTQQVLHKTGETSKTVFESLFSFIVSILKVFFSVLRILLGVILMLMGVMLFIALVALVFGWGGDMIVDSDVNILAFPVLARLLVGCDVNMFFLESTFLLFFGVPFFALAYYGTWLIFRFRKIPHFGLTMFNLWIVGLVFSFFYAFRILNLYKHDDSVTQTYRVEKGIPDTLRIGFIRGDTMMRYLDYDVHALVDGTDGVITEDEGTLIVPEIGIGRSDDSAVEVIRTIRANGRTTPEARNRIAAVTCPVILSDSSLLLSPFFAIPKGECWRGQEVFVSIRIPEGKWIVVDPRLRNHYFRHDYFGGYESDSVLHMTADGLKPFLFR